MHPLSTNEIKQVSGGGAGETMSTIAMTSGGAALGGYYGAMWFGASVGAAAGPVGAVVGAVAFGGFAYAYYKCCLKK